MSQKIPLFNGVIASLEAAVAPGATLPVFTPPDSDSDAPNIYEVHLFMSPRRANGASDTVEMSVRAYEDPATTFTVWRAPTTSAAINRSPISKMLDGYPVRGGVSLDFQAVGSAQPGDEIFLWGYYHRVGQGVLKEAERRPIGQALTPFNAGIPFALAPGASAIVHIFQQNRIDEISLAAVFGDTVGATDTVSLLFEDANNVPVSSIATFRPATAVDYDPLASARVLPPEAALFPPSPYFIYQCPFGGGAIPTLHHLRVTNNAVALPVSIHGYFTRR